MVSQERTFELNEKTQAFLADPGAALHTINEDTANGGNLIDFCKTRDLRFSDVYAWINGDKKRRKAFDRAEKDGDAWLIKRILSEIKKIGTVDVRKAYDKDGKLLPIHDIPEDVARCVVQVTSEELFEGRGDDRTMVGYTKRLKFSDKLKALELLGKHLKVFIDRLEHSGKVSLEDLLKGAFLDEPPTPGNRARSLMDGGYTRQ